MASLERFLFPTDFSERAERALEQAVRLARLRKGEVIVQHVVRDYFEDHPHWTTLFDIHEMQKLMDMHIDREMARTVSLEGGNGVRFRQVLSKGKPAGEIVGLAEKEKVDLIVMGPGRASVTGAVIRGSAQPVLAIPDGDPERKLPDRISRILVATDLSRDSRKVVDYAFGLKELFGCEIHLLHAVDLTETVRFALRQGHFTDAPVRLKEWAENQLKNLTPHASLGDPTVHRLVEEGPTAETIAASADKLEADVVIVGAHGYGPVEKRFAGATTNRLLEKLTRPVLTVRIGS